ncbi:MAG: nucleoside monophosphate kinase [Patescibacteria group bacterium]|nr:nucleoside monophosphate kinase [Patescibacteria group bacterium]
MKKQYKIIVLGSQGSGKGTQSQLLAEKLKISAVSMGDLLRAEKKKGGKLGKKLSSFMDNGLLVPHEITIKLIKKALKKSKKGIVVDGFPRDMEQVKSFEKFFEPTHIIFIKISSKETMRRLSGRRVCSKCNENYHLVFKKPKKKDVCNKCKGKLRQRDDDKPNAIKKRLEIFRKNTMPVIRFYKKKYGTLEINGEQAIKKVSKEVEKALKNRS